MADTKMVLVTNVSGSKLSFVHQELDSIAGGEKSRVIVATSGKLKSVAVPYVFIKTEEEFYSRLIKTIHSVYRHPNAKIFYVVKPGGVMPHLRRGESLPPNVYVYEFLKEEGLKGFLRRHTAPAT